MNNKIHCKKCHVFFEPKIIEIKKTYTNNDKLNPLMFDRIYKRPQYKTCQLCRNIKKACDLINKEMFG